MAAAGRGTRLNHTGSFRVTCSMNTARPEKATQGGLAQNEGHKPRCSGGRLGCTAGTPPRPTRTLVQRGLRKRAARVGDVSVQLAIAHPVLLRSGKEGRKEGVWWRGRVRARQDGYG